MEEYKDDILNKLKQDKEHLVELMEKGNNHSRLIEKEWIELQIKDIEKQKKNTLKKLKKNQKDLKLKRLIG